MDKEDFIRTCSSCDYKGLYYKFEYISNEEYKNYTNYVEKENEDKYLCSWCYDKHQYFKMVEEIQPKKKCPMCIGGQAFDIRGVLFCSPKCGNEYWDLKPGDEDYWPEDDNPVNPTECPISGP